ncbi:MAG: FAD-dependent monooxygenase [Variovorax sp.]
MNTAAFMPSADQLPPSVGAFEYTRFAPSLPPLQEGREPGCHPVVIAGGGPVGMSLALGLANHGVGSVILEADDTVCVGSRAACISRRSLEIVERLGALPAFLAKGLPWTGGRSFYKTREVFRFEMPHDERQKLPPMINLEQYYIEQYLLDEIGCRNAAAPGLIDLRWGTELTGFVQTADGVELQARNARGAYALHAQWLVACDGGQSMVRKALGLELKGTAYEGRYVIIDIELHSTHPTERRAWFDPPWNPGSTVLMHRQPDDIWRIDYQLRPGQSTEEALQPDAVQDFVQRHLDAIGEGHLPWKAVWTSVYRAGAMTLDTYRHGRVLFAGNAAHAMPIFGVRGLNSGFDDADNLAWKLALVARGVSEASLLDSYSQERIAAFHINAEAAMRSTEFMSPPSRGFDLMREAALSLSGAHRGIANIINPRQTQAVRYERSALSSESDELPAGPRRAKRCPISNSHRAASHRLDRTGVHGAGAEHRPDGRCTDRPNRIRASRTVEAGAANTAPTRRMTTCSQRWSATRRRVPAAPRRPRRRPLASRACRRAGAGAGTGRRIVNGQGERMTSQLAPDARDRLYAECASAIAEAGVERESLFLARLALLLFEQVGDESLCRTALADALDGLPVPSLSALTPQPQETSP